MASDAKVSFLPKVEYRAVIRYLYLKGKRGQEIHCKLTNVYGSSAPSYAQVKFWVGEFKRSRTSSEDETRSGHPSDATDEEMCNKVRDLVYSDRPVKVEEIANALHISWAPVAWWIRALTLNPLGFSPLWFEPSSGHMWESQALLTDGQVVFLRVLRFSSTFDERSARYK